MKSLIKVLLPILVFTSIIQAGHWSCPNDLRKFITHEAAAAICGTRAYQQSDDLKTINKKSYHSLGDEGHYRSAGGITDTHDNDTHDNDDDNHDD